MIIPIDPRIKELALKAVRACPGRSLKVIAQEHGVGESTLRGFAKAAGIQRKRGVKPWRIRIHPRDWSPAQRRIAHTEGVLADGLAEEHSND